MKPVRSAFAPMKPSLASTALKSSKPAATPDTPAPSVARSPIGSNPSDRSDREDRQPASVRADTPSEIVPVQLQVRVILDDSRSNIGFAHLGWNLQVRSIVGTLNRSNPLTERALRSSDSALVAFLWGLLIAELLLVRRSRDPGVAAVLAYLMAKLNPPGCYMTAIATSLLKRLQRPFANLEGAYGPSSPRESEHISVAQLAIPMPRVVAARPWGKQAEKPGIKAAVTSERRVLGQRGSSEISQNDRKAAE